MAKQEQSPYSLAKGEVLLRLGWAYGLPGTKESDSGAWYFAVNRQVVRRKADGDAMQALRLAVRDHLEKPDSNADGVSFNWGDAIAELSEEDWAKYGLRLLDTPVPEFSLHVDHDEVFESPEEDNLAAEEDEDD